MQAVVQVNTNHHLICAMPVLRRAGEVMASLQEQKLGRAVARLESARDTVETAIVDARTAGMTLRAIAAIAGVSHEEVRRIVARVDSA